MSAGNSHLYRRINKEIQMIQNDNLDGISAGPSGDEIYKWNAIIIGPQGTPYEGGTYFLDITFPNNYPQNPPRIIFKTPIYHPNISTQGSICLDLLKNNWSPSLSIGKILLSITSLLNDPNPNDPLNTDAAKTFLDDRNYFNSIAKTITISNN